MYHKRLKEIEAQDMLIPRLRLRTSLREGEATALSVAFSSFSGVSVLGGKLVWDLEGIEDLRGEEPVRLLYKLDVEPKCGSYPIAQLGIAAPPVARPWKHVIQLKLRDAEGNVVARNSQNIDVAPAISRTLGKGTTVWLYDPLGSAIGLSLLLTGIGCRVVAQPEPGALGLVTRWNPAVLGFLHDEGRAVLVATHPKSITVTSGLGLWLLERNTNGWWVDWRSSKTWFVPEHFPSLPDTIRFDYEYEPIVPERVLTGPLTENIVAGRFVGWLHNPAALVARLPIGSGEPIVTTFNLLPNLGSDPIATVMLHDLFKMATATWPD